ncbi:MAG: mycofactocin precursor MftA [Actinomycetota bacterium]|nr:mycofactocin precursor MftA [Actinomycetota bacterium]
MSDPTTDDTTAVAAEDTDVTDELVTEELVTEELVEEVSIDGMCGVY